MSSLGVSTSNPDSPESDDCTGGCTYTPPSSGLGSMRDYSSYMDSGQQSREETVNHGPPKLAPVSGVFESKCQTVVRPVAYRPIMPVSLTPARFSTPAVRKSLPVPSPLSTESDSKNYYNLSQSSYLLDDDHRSVTYSLDSCIKTSENVCSYGTSYLGSGSTLNLDDFINTPSPSDSGVAEMEAILRDKDSEINYLRETLEQNEQVIFKVYEEKEQNWLREIKKLRIHFDQKLRVTQQRLAKAEQLSFQAQQEKRKMQADLEELRREKNNEEQKNDVLRQELDQCQSLLEETEWTLCQKTGEISLLKSQLKGSQGDQTTRATELLSLKAQLKEKQLQLTEKNQKIGNLQEDLMKSREEVCHAKQEVERMLQNIRSQTQSPSEPQTALLNHFKEEVERLRSELAISRKQLEITRDNIEEERIQWLEEKEKVIKYQKQLQLNYVQMYRRNRTLESELEHMTLELGGVKDFNSLAGESQC
ncbi:leucine zipper putative tumor suppressor 2 homolog [Limulus polyphemus]|uniref:Leucine zipper putative tumor suppressor 2 homolog n=1 Tax=Limulus polyphemus TaxID=6850 RepID=A0ABM1SEG1_LIMPO|nr:leucine zipper putative tumor suppressor 2 homolog [Limulus polyphemus]XP_022242016.1 leucine zipper putative tumor suppressor 2 homolog [Limulus polyphemus]